MKKILTIAGSDCSGGAGIQADIKTITAHKMYAMSVITALTAQNTLGVTAISEATPEFVGRQLDAVFTDIFPDAVKIGMVASAAIIEVIAQKLRAYKAVNVVVDPVMVSTSGSRLISDDAKLALQNLLFPLAAVVTPNIPEAAALSGLEITNEAEMVRAGALLAKNFGVAVLVKGGHKVNDATDYLCANDESVKAIAGERIDNPNTHGTGCTLSSAIACGLADGKGMEESVRAAKRYLTGALNAQLNLGRGAGPLDHMWNL
ncbi:MAG: bifunctional hydroxymethylpyrimidine kinase/phosphomethylpyrimidine kinase [Clostridiales bacterium]|nr:bifunctional hydroxymethylpyrimidine kinase/phosphomethylpyrimidine kinase [Clostridiales bacterium]